MKNTLPKLPYDYNALEPYFDEMTMTIHHSKHHQAYVDNLNVALDKHPELYEKDLATVLKNLESVPSDIQMAVRNNGGGHYNHSLFWSLLAQNQGSGPVGQVAKAIVQTFGSLEAFKEQFETAGKTRFGSGWAWLIVTEDKTLKVMSTPNQDTPLNEGKPVLTLDVWEHAYYLKYQNRRPDFIKAFWNVVNWNKVEELYLEAIK